MSQMSQALSRMLALVAFTALFAGMWSNDHPAQAMAMKTAPIPRGIVHVEPEWVPIASPMVPAEALSSLPKSSPAVEMEIVLGTRSKSFRVEADELLIAEEILQAHLNQLPLGMAPGDYRIIDTLGGVGWLHIQVQGNTPTSPPRPPRLLTTTVDEENMQFVHVSSPATSAGITRPRHEPR